MRDVLSKAAQIRLVIFDVDGVLTDGRLYFGNDGDEFKAFYIRDGHGIKMLLDAGVDIAIISGRRALSVERRMADLGIRHVHLGVQDKRAAFDDLLAQLNLIADQVAYVGDDLIDLPVMTQVGLAIAVQDADPFVRRHAHWQTPHRGGRGAARDVCELLLEARGQLESARSRYL
ncbi:MAG: 3-deoxy-manno-octulosonate-8-phosphatase KdsC [Gammaproteobacteria bacterium]|nr:3-deoxy-manno-octulosonate-8-phosphatase KdsC [Gammaproteobacteria bacterium]